MRWTRRTSTSAAVIVVALGICVGQVAPSSAQSGSRSAPQAEAADPLALVAPGTNPAIPADGLPAGAVVVLLDGVQQQVQVRRLKSRVRIEGISPTGLDIWGTAAPRPGRGEITGPRLRLTSDGAVTLRPGGMLDRITDEGGYLPRSTARWYLSGLSGPLAEQRTTAEGILTGLPTIDIPTSTKPGVHLLQLNGFAPDGRVLSVSLGVMVAVKQEPVPALRLPRRVNDVGTTRLVRLPIVTDAGQKVSVSVECWAFASRQLPKRICHPVTLKSGWIGVWQSGRRATRVFVELTAPDTVGYSAYHKLRVYETRAVR